MSSKPIRSGTSVAKLVEKQMRNWEIARAQRLEVPEVRRKVVQPYIALSRKLGSGGNEVAAALGQKLAWPVFDKEILQTMAGDDDLRRQIYQSMDERDLSWFEETVRSFMEGAFRKNDYLKNLSRTILSLARQGSSVFVGRAADRILPREAGLRILITARDAYCLEQYARRRNVSKEAVREEWERIMEERREFSRKYFHIEQDDPARFDLCINRERFTVDQAVEKILSAMRALHLIS